MTTTELGDEEWLAINRPDATPDEIELFMERTFDEWRRNGEDDHKARLWALEKLMEDRD